jgi:hypothetical protein
VKIKWKRNYKDSKCVHNNENNTIHSLTQEGFVFQIPEVGLLPRIPRIILHLNGDFPRWAVAFFEKCCYKWRLRKFLGLDMTKNWPKKIHNITICFWCSFHFLKRISKLWNFATKIIVKQVD